MCDAWKKAKVLPETILCKLILEYPHTVSDPSTSGKIYYIEMAKNSSIQFLNNLKEHTEERICGKKSVKAPVSERQ